MGTRTARFGIFVCPDRLDSSQRRPASRKIERSAASRGDSRRFRRGRNREFPPSRPEPFGCWPCLVLPWRWLRWEAVGFQSLTRRPRLQSSRRIARPLRRKRSGLLHPPPRPQSERDRAGTQTEVKTPPEASKAPATTLAIDGPARYRQHCAACHGDQGDGNGLAARFLYPKPRNFRDGRFRLVTTSNSVPSDDDLDRVLTRGLPGSAMFPFGHLTQEERQASDQRGQDVRARWRRRSVEKGGRRVQ